MWMDDELTFEYTTHQNSDNILQLFYLYPSVDEVDISEYELDFFPKGCFSKDIVAALK